MRQFSPIDSNEVVTLTSDFSADLQSGEILTGTPTFTLLVASGTDATPAARLNGAPQISGVYVLQSVKTCVSGTNYYALAICSTSAGRVLTQGGRLDCVPAYLQ